MKHYKVDFATYENSCPCNEEHRNILNAFSVTTNSSSVGGGFNFDLVIK